VKKVERRVEEPKKKAETKRPEPEPTVVVAKPKPPDPVPAAPAVDHAALGDKAKDEGDFRTAYQHYKALGDAARLAALQRSVEGDAEERGGALADTGRYDQALALVNSWLQDFPGSQRLQRLQAKIVRARTQ
jgi:tetratricopeptide (TPR) repeat protein